MDGNEFKRRMEAGDRTVFDALYPMLRRIVLGACRDLGVNDSLKEDAMQDVAEKVLTQWRSYLGQSALSTWLYSIARHRCLDDMRKRKVRGEDRNRKANPSNNASVSSPIEPSHDEKFELMLCVQQVFAELEAQGPARRGSHRMVDVLMHTVEHSPTMEELSSHLGTSVQAAKQRLYEIRKHLGELCRKYCGHDDCSLHITGGAS